MQPDSENRELGDSAASPRPLPTRLKLRIAASTLIKPSSRPRLGTGNVIVLPFNKMAKLDVPANEIATMEFVRENTTIPVPKILNIYGRQPDGSAHLVMTRLPGTELSDALPDMTAAQIDSVVHELAGYLAQLRQLTAPRPSTATANAPSIIIGGAAGGPGFDHRLGPRPWGPFGTVAEFHTYVRFGEPLEDWAHEPAVTEVHGKPEGSYQVRFAHADLAPRNILVDPKEGKITGIVDWEFGGWYPEYWEYTKMYYGGVRPHLEQWFAAIEKEPGIDKYEAERRAEEAIWLRAGPFGYV